MHLRAYAKINPFLEITGKRDDGYHDLSIVFRPVSLYDELVVEKTSGKGKLIIECNLPRLCGEDNILNKAYNALNARFPGISSYNVKLTKIIPSGAGMGGGSSDAAAFLKAVNHLENLGLSTEQLCEVGAGIGADVPACLYRVPCSAGGIGEKLSMLDAPAKQYYIVIKPAVSFNTGAMYAKYDEVQSPSCKKKKIDKTLSAIAKGDTRAEAASYFNVFEKVVPEKKLISELKKLLKSNGAEGALMTGSGSCVFGVYEDKKNRDVAARRIKKLFASEDAPEACTVYTCESVNELRRQLHYVYIFECRDKTLYTGWTTDLKRREAAHNGTGGARYTKSHGGGRIVYYEIFDCKSDALAREHSIKQMSKEEKNSLVKGFKV